MALNGKTLHSNNIMNGLWSDGVISSVVRENEEGLTQKLRVAAYVCDVYRETDFKAAAHKTFNGWLNDLQLRKQINKPLEGVCCMEGWNFIPNIDFVGSFSELSDILRGYLEWFSCNTQAQKIFYFYEEKEFWVVVTDKTYESVQLIRKEHIKRMREDFIDKCIVLENSQIDYNSMPTPSFELRRSE